MDGTNSQTLIKLSYVEGVTTEDPWTVKRKGSEKDMLYACVGE